MPDVIDQSFITRFQSSSNHCRTGQVTAVVQVRASVAKSNGLVFLHDFLEGGITRIVPGGDHNAQAFGFIDESRESIATRVSHDHNAIRFGSQGFLELVDHLLIVPTGILFDEFDIQCFSCGFGTIGARKG